MKKSVKRLFAAVAVVALTLPLFACKPSKKPPDTGKNSKMFMENDFVNDKNLLPARVKEVTVTFASGATFKDGSTSKKCVVGDTLKFGEDILYTGVLGEGKTIGGYFDENNVFYKGANYTVTRNDIALTPAPDVLESQYAPKSGGEKGGKIGTGEEREDGGNNKTAYRKEWRDGIVDNELGGIYHFVAGTREAPDPDGKIPVGFCFTNQTPYQVIAEKEYSIDYRVQNLAQEDVTVKIRQSNRAATAYLSEVISDTITLKPGETKKTSTKIVGWNNTNVLNAVELMNEVKELNLGIIKSVRVFDHVVVKYELTLLNGATLENGKTNGSFKAGEEISIKYTPASGKVLLGWANADDETETYPADKFVMPAKNIRIKPIVGENVKYSLTVSGGKLPDGSTKGGFVKGESITLTCDNVPAGKTLVGWYNVSDRTEIFGRDGDVNVITMPAKELEIAPLFDVSKYFGAGGGKIGKLVPDGHYYPKKEVGCYNAFSEKRVAAVKNREGGFELANLYRFKGGTREAPAEKMAVGSHFLPQAMNHWGSAGNTDKTKTVTYTVENFGTEDVTLRFALTKESGNPDSQYGEKTVTIAAGETITFEFDVDYLHNSFMTNVMVKDKAVSEVYIGFFTYITNKA